MTDDNESRLGPKSKTYPVRLVMTSTSECGTRKFDTFKSEPMDALLWGMAIAGSVQDLSDELLLMLLSTNIIDIRQTWIDIKFFINWSNYSRVHCQQKDCSCRENKSHEIPWWLSKHASISKVKNIPHCLKEKHNVMRVEEENEISSAHSCMVKEKNRRTWVLCDYCFRVGMSTRWRAAGYRGIQKKWTKK